jgi:DNA-binding response OmpR family regulator
VTSPGIHPRVLVVENTLPVLVLFRDALDRAGFAVDTATTAREALDRLAAQRFAARYAVIVADCTLPDLPALDWLAALRGAALAVPLILQSGRIPLAELAAYAAEFGAVAALEKPFPVGQLLAAVRAAVATP